MKQKYSYSILLLLFGFFSFSQTLDQSSTPTLCCTTVTTSSYSSGQSFTAGTSALLSQINVQFINSGTDFNPGDFKLTVYDGDGYAGNVLSTTTFALGSLPNGSFTEIPITLSTPISITSGNIYTFDIKGIGVSSARLGFGGPGNPYIGGGIYHGNGNTDIYNNFDLWFKTFTVTSIPTPATHLNFDGSNDVVNLGNGLTTYFTGRTAATVEAWVYPNSNTGFNVILGNYNYPSNINELQMLLRQQNNDYAFYVNGGSGYVAVVASGAVTANTWQHVSGTWDGTTLTIYVNGVSAASTPLTGAFPSTSTSFSIGNNAIGENFGGSIDEVRIWDVALSLTDIQDTMNCELVNGQNNVVAYYKFNQGFNATDNTGVTTLTDETGNHNGTLINFALTGATSNWQSGSSVTTGNTCSAILSSSDFEAIANLKVYPNPSNGLFNISSQEDVTIEVYDIVGKVIVKQKIANGLNAIDISSYTSGIYLLKATNNAGNVNTYKIVKQ